MCTARTSAPHAPTTALALLALQDRRDDPVVRGEHWSMQKEDDGALARGAVA